MELSGSSMPGTVNWCDSSPVTGPTFWTWPFPGERDELVHHSRRHGRLTLVCSLFLCPPIFNWTVIFLPVSCTRFWPLGCVLTVISPLIGRAFIFGFFFFGHCKRALIFHSTFADFSSPSIFTAVKVIRLKYFTSFFPVPFPSNRNLRDFARLPL